MYFYNVVRGEVEDKALFLPIGLGVKQKYVFSPPEDEEEREKYVPIDEDESFEVGDRLAVGLDVIGGSKAHKRHVGITVAKKKYASGVPSFTDLYFADAVVHKGILSIQVPTPVSLPIIWPFLTPGMWLPEEDPDPLLTTFEVWYDSPTRLYFYPLFQDNGPATFDTFKRKTIGRLFEFKPYSFTF